MKRMVQLVAVSGALLFFCPSADAKLGSASGSAVQFNAAGPAGMAIVGKTTDLQVADDGQNVTVTVGLSSLSTGIGLRDKHMKEKYLQVQTYPTADLVVPRASLKVPSGGAVNASAQGTMKIHGKAKPVTFTYTAKPDGGKITVSGSVRVNVQDYGIEIPSYMGVTVKPDVDVSVQFTTADG